MPDRIPGNLAPERPAAAQVQTTSARLWRRASSSFFLISSASSLEHASLTAFGALSTRSLASFRPSPVMARTSLMTLIFLSPNAGENDVELGPSLLLGRFGRHRQDRPPPQPVQRRNAPFFFQQLRKLCSFQYTSGWKGLLRFFQDQPFYIPSFRFEPSPVTGERLTPLRPSLRRRQTPGPPGRQAPARHLSNTGCRRVDHADNLRPQLVQRRQVSPVP